MFNLNKRLEESPTFKKFSKVVKIILIGFFAIIVLSIIFGGGESESPAIVDESPTDSQAHIIAQYFVTDVLVAPSTADFPTYEYSSSRTEDGTWIIRSYVDSQNSFGAMLRTNWIVALRHDDGEWADQNNWTLRYLLLGDEEYVIDEDFFGELEGTQ